MGDTIAQTRSVKKLENKDRSRTHRLKRLYKVGLTARIESSDNEESLGEDASKQGRIDAIDADEEITLVSVHDVNVSTGEEVFATIVNDITLAQVLKEMKSDDEVNVVEEVVKIINTAKLITDAVQVSAIGNVVSTGGAATTVSAATTTTDDDGDITLAQVLKEMKSEKPKKKGVVIQELEHMKPMNKKDLIKLDKETALNLQTEFDEEEIHAREKAKKEEEANIALVETWDDIQAKIDVDHQLAERIQAQEQEEFSIEEKATLFQQLLEKRRKHFASKRAEEKRNKPPTKSQ
ncbi:hypothetical protein Tco_1440335 [Tanacetum coccineum]